MVSSAGVTGDKQTFNDEQITYFKRISELKLKNPQIVGFGISNSNTFKQATLYANGAIIGSAFIKFIENNELSDIKIFVEAVLEMNR